MASLADTVLPLIRTRSDLHRLAAANQHGRQMHEAIDALEAARSVTSPADFYAVVHAALASAVKVIARADDSSGIIGDACRRLLALHPEAAAEARVAPGKVVDWMIKFQFDGDVDYFEIDPVAYGPALGDIGMKAYREQLDAVRATLGPEPAESDRWSTPHRHERFVLEWNDQRLAVYDRDVHAIIRTHARDRRVAAWLHDTARAFEEIGEIDLAIDWALQASDHHPSHQALQAAEYWCELLARHRPAELLAARREVFRRWPSAMAGHHRPHTSVVRPGAFRTPPCGPPRRTPPDGAGTRGARLARVAAGHHRHVRGSRSPRPHRAAHARRHPHRGCAHAGRRTRGHRRLRRAPRPGGTGTRYPGHRTGD